MTTDNRTDFQKAVDSTIDNHIPDRREHTGPDRRQLDHLPMTEKRDGRTADRRSVVVNTAVRPAGGPNGKDLYRLVIEGDRIRKEKVPNGELPEPWSPKLEDDFSWATVPGTDEHELATLDRACEDENRALKVCCERAATEIFKMIWDTFTTETDPRTIEPNEYAAIIYKHMRNGREL
jgi:hypothetical protein